MKPNYLIVSLAALALLPSTANAFQECMATLKDPHGSVKVLRYGKLVATLKGGEHFLVEPMPDGWNVYLKSGCDGFIEKKVALQLLPNEPLMKLNYGPEKTEWQKRQSDRGQLGEAGTAFKGRGLNYFKILTAASNGDEKATARFFSVCGDMDGAAAEDCCGRGWQLFHVIGDETFARFLSGQPVKMRKWIAGIFSGGDTDPISKPKPYIKRYFPKTYKLLFANER